MMSLTCLKIYQYTSLYLGKHLAVLGPIELSGLASVSSSSLISYYTRHPLENTGKYSPITQKVLEWSWLRRGGTTTMLLVHSTL